MRTAVYIDGYNLYYGAIRRTDYKWLDLVSLFEAISKRNRPLTNCEKLKYFSAPVKAKFSAHGTDSMTAQHAYHRALTASYPGQLEIILGRHQEWKVSKILMSDPIDINNKVDVLNIEEKQTDVNIALEMYRDACSGQFDQQVLVTGDSDLEPALKMIRLDHPEITLGLILPVRGVRTNMAGGLLKLVDWNENHIGLNDLSKYQLPNVVKIGNHIKKPRRW